MKKNNLVYCWIVFVIGIVFSCSYDDKSMTIGKELPEIVIDTTGVSDGSSRLYVMRDSILSIHPKIVYEGAADDDFEYEWRLAIVTDKEVVYSIGEYIVLSKEKDLDWKVDLYETIDYQFYQLWFRVKHKATGVIASIHWALSVSTEIPWGLLVIDTEDGRTCDFSVIRDSVINRGMCAKFQDDKKGLPTEYDRNIYSKNHGYKFDGLIRGIFHQKLYKGAALTHYMHGFTDNNRIFRMETSHFDIVAEGKDLFYDPDVELKIDNYRDFGPWSDIKGILVNDGKLYRRENEVSGATDICKFGNPQKQICRIPAQVCGNNKLAFYSEEDGKFYWTEVRSFDDSKPPKPFNTVEGAQFDPNDMKGYENVIAWEYFTDEFRFILKKDGKYVYCALNASSMNPGVFFDLSQAPDIDKAIAFDIATYESLIFYATPDKVYVINYASDLQYQVFYDPQEPILNIWLNRGSYDASMDHTHESLWINTYDGSEGKLYFMPFDKTGNINYLHRFVPGVYSFGGFKKILCVANIM